MTLHVCTMGFDCPYGYLNESGSEPTHYCTYPSLGLQVIWEDLKEVDEDFECRLMAENTLLGEVLQAYEDAIAECDELFEGDSE